MNAWRASDQGQILVGTGHRPQKLGGFDAAVDIRLRAFAQYVLVRQQADAEVRDTGGVTAVISGMAIGWDMALAEAALEAGLPLIAAVPFQGQESRWPPDVRARYKGLLEAAARVEVVCEGGYAAWKMQQRNIWMVDHGDRVLALWDGTSGGTANCVRYAVKEGRSVVNLWREWRAFEPEPEASSGGGVGLSP
jgi:uncharacterized phage-like protein YoqJ